MTRRTVADGQPQEGGVQGTPPDLNTPSTGTDNFMANNVGQSFAGKVPVVQGTYESLFDPGAGYERQQTQLNQIGQQAAGVGQWGYGTMTDARDQSMGYYNPAQSTWDNAYGPGGTQSMPGFGEQAFYQNGSSMLGNTQSQDAYGYGSSLLSDNNPQADMLWQTQQHFQSNPGLQQGLYGMAQDQFSQPGAQQSMLSQYGNGVANNKYLGGTQGYQGGAQGSSDYANYMFGQNSGQLTTPGAMERFAAQSLDTANDPYYQQLQKQQSAQLDASMNARGAYNSGAALAAQALGNSNLAAQQYHQQADIQRSGQDAQNQRLATGLGYGTGTSAANLAGNMGAGNLGVAAGGVQNQGYNALFGLGQGVDQNQIGRVNSMGNIAQGADMADLGQWQLMGNQANNVGGQNVSNVNAIGNLGHAASSDALAGQQAYQGAATGAENLQNDRVQGGITSAYNLGNGMANQYTGSTDKAIQDYNDMIRQYIQSATAATTAGMQADQKNQGGAMGMVKNIIGGIGSG